jgi:cytochrome c oxidase assembly protein subunit 15
MLRRPEAAAPRPAAISRWLIAVAALIFAMVVVGGITRLTESGLSIVRWEPVSGAVPPLSQDQWQAEFDAYRATPQYRQVNRGMTLADFKQIYFWEYVHRLLGRLIGLAFALPLLWFWWRRAIPAGEGWKLGGLLALGALQGAIGWWMVASGLVERPEVSHVRLAIHLLTALAIFGAMIWVALDMRALARGGEPGQRAPLLAVWTLSVLFLQFLFGAYVAGLGAGYAFNSWPLMGDELFPSETPMSSPFMGNFADNPVVVQFVHRWLAFVAAGLVLSLAVAAYRAGRRGHGLVLAAAVIFQVQLGILTLLTGVEIRVAAAHQAMAALLLAAVVATAHALREAPAAKPAAA